MFSYKCAAEHHTNASAEHFLYMKNVDGHYCIPADDAARSKIIQIIFYCMRFLFAFTARFHGNIMIMITGSKLFTKGRHRLCTIFNFFSTNAC